MTSTPLVLLALLLLSLATHSPAYADKNNLPIIHCNKNNTNKTPMTWGVKIHNTYPHRSTAFTQGLIYQQGKLFESTGHYGQSTVSHLDIETGEVIKQLALDKDTFGEGITLWHQQLIQLTWKSGKVYRYSLPELTLEKTQDIQGEGWGITHNTQSLITSNGSAQLSFRDPITLAVESTVNVSYLGRPLKKLNELEWVNGCVLANIWQSRFIAIINPTSGQTTGLINLGRIVAHEQKTGTSEVANGIAWLADKQRLLVTGKYWQHIYEIELVPSQ